MRSPWACSLSRSRSAHVSTKEFGETSESETWVEPVETSPIEPLLHTLRLGLKNNLLVECRGESIERCGSGGADTALDLADFRLLHAVSFR